MDIFQGSVVRTPSKAFIPRNETTENSDAHGTPINTRSAGISRSYWKVCWKLEARLLDVGPCDTGKLSDGCVQSAQQCCRLCSRVADYLACHAARLQDARLQHCEVLQSSVYMPLHVLLRR